MQEHKQTVCKKNILMIITFMRSVFSLFSIYAVRCRKIKNVLEVKKELKDIVNDWMVLGEELGVSSSKLKKIEADRRGDVERMTSEMITAWFNGSANAGWEQLVKALKEIGRDRIAHDIIERKC